MIRSVLAIILAAMSAVALQEAKTPEKLAPYYPTPETVVERMLLFGELKAGEKMFDLAAATAAS
jgi:hypothetical protein